MALIWGLGAMSILVLASVAPIFRGFGVVLGIGCAIGAVIRSVQGYRRMIVDQRLKFFGKEFIDLDTLQAKSRQASGNKAYWLGRGLPTQPLVVRLAPSCWLISPLWQGIGTTTVSTP